MNLQKQFHQSFHMNDFTSMNRHLTNNSNYPIRQTILDPAFLPSGFRPNTKYYLEKVFQASGFSKQALHRIPVVDGFQHEPPGKQLDLLVARIWILRTWNKHADGLNHQYQ